MASYNFTIPNDQVARVVAAFVQVFPKGESELTDAAWAKLQMREFVKRTVKRAETATAEIAARDSVTVSDDIIAEA